MTERSAESREMDGQDEQSNAPSAHPGTNTKEPVRVGLAGAGAWAHTMHAPTLAAGPETTLTAVYARRAEAADELAAKFGATGTTRFEELLARCDAVAFAIRPDIQAELAKTAARAGKAILLEKPLALSLEAARELADVVSAEGIVSQLVLTKRYHESTRLFLSKAASLHASGARSCYLHGAFLGGALATGWRLEYGALMDLGPHLLDLLEAALGRIATIRATGDSARWIELTCEHETGAVSEASLSGAVRLNQVRTTVELFSPEGFLVFDSAEIDHAESWPIIRAEFAAAVKTGRSHELNVRTGLRLQELIDLALLSLKTGAAQPAP
jgi:predicted dehydrogenase